MPVLEAEAVWHTTAGQLQTAKSGDLGALGWQYRGTEAMGQDDLAVGWSLGNDMLQVCCASMKEVWLQA